MIINSTQVSYFILSAYFDTGMLKYLYFTIILCLYVLIILSNVFLIVVICVNRSLHEPMYLFLCSLFVNQLYGSTGLFPFILLQILKDVHTVSFSLCVLQIFCLYSYVQVEMINLTVMSYDRYLSICFPLQYHTRMTHNKIGVLITVVWVLSLLKIAIGRYMTVSLQLCGNIIDKIYCDHYSIVELSCSDTTDNNIYGLINAFISICVPVMLILYSYMRILKVCFSGSKQTRHKAVSTCTPHLASLINFTLGCCFEVVQRRFNMNHVPNTMRIFLSVYFVILQPVFNPMVYGLKMSKIRVKCNHLLCGKRHLDSES
ncbi:olfactory receptor 52D1-like [Sphaeramia orbicularis]|uniref:olfactory receptor 52D1-like n=1 Tax=Sphaeramia orbicularis TaxID=375764 RepID=UPI00117FA8B2|nr:olfactory receptor 52D1-like [Sphaeramia orbicularis]